MQITNADFSKSLLDFMGGQSLVHARFADGADSYTVRMQRQFGVTGDCIDCIPRLNGKDAWQVFRSQQQSSTVGNLLVLIAGMPAGTDAEAFFTGRA